MVRTKKQVLQGVPEALALGPTTLQICSLEPPFPYSVMKSRAEPITFLVNSYRTGKMSQWLNDLRALVALPEDSGWIPSRHCREWRQGYWIFLALIVWDSAVRQLFWVYPHSRNPLATLYQEAQETHCSRQFGLWCDSALACHWRLSGQSNCLFISSQGKLI